MVAEKPLGLAESALAVEETASVDARPHLSKLAVAPLAAAVAGLAEILFARAAVEVLIAWGVVDSAVAAVACVVEEEGAGDREPAIIKDRENRIRLPSRRHPIRSGLGASL